MTKNLMLTAVALMAAIAAAAADADTARRPMLVQGKTWHYTYNHFEEKDPTGSSGSFDDYYNYDSWPVRYKLEGDTVIGDRQYMKMYRYEKYDQKGTYAGAYREDEEGRVYVHSRYAGDDANGDRLMIDFSLNFDGDGFDDARPVAETIVVNNREFRRYRYHSTRPDGTEYTLGYTAVEGVGFREYGLVNYLFAPQPDCICDYESFDYVSGDGFYFTDADFAVPKIIPLTTLEKQLVEQNNDFAIRLFSQARKEESFVLSPLSVTYALGMINNGAAGQTQREINEVLGFGETGADGINDFCQKMLTESPTLDEQTRVSIANAIFVNSGVGCQLQDLFAETVRLHYEAELQSRDFHDGLTIGVINKWVNDRTEGMIPAVFDEQNFQPDITSYLLNAVYFKGAWQLKFDPTRTASEPFNGGGDVPMMHQSDRFEYTENDLYQAVKLPYGNGAYTMNVYLPREGKTVADVLNAMSGESWTFNGSMYDVDLKLPRFETDAYQELKYVMADLGMPTAFNMETAEFPYFCNTNVYITSMFQIAKIKLDEEGTEAAAVTVVGPGGSAEPRVATFHASRPFLYIISEQSTGSIFFIGQYMGNTTAGLHNPSPNTHHPSSLYNLNGQRLSTPPSRGLYIQNGRKVLAR